MHFFCFLLFWESFNCYNFGTTGPIQVGFSAKCTSPDEDFSQIENWKCHMFNFWLIPLDRITLCRSKAAILKMSAHCRTIWHIWAYLVYIYNLFILRRKSRLRFGSGHSTFLPRFCILWSAKYLRCDINIGKYF